MSDSAIAVHEVGCAPESPPEEAQHSLQKQKLDEENQNQHKKGKLIPYYDPNELTEEEAQRYAKQVQESQGFDVEKFGNKCPFGIIMPIVNLQKGSLLHQDVTVCSILAIDTYNKDNDTTYQFTEVIKVNTYVCSGVMFFITFKAQDAAADGDDSPKIFQARVHRGITENKVKLCRLKPN
ncbi:unnamed protein product [Ilex paraguariensis]|uniref:Cystatin domain-containing protein n=1 Tax=Ilex paraguariensis TaxID=185542 RepID=A0ABC8SLH9_9AQUA